MAVLVVVEFVDELVDGARGAALPLIRSDFHLSYAQLGLLLSLPVILGNLIEAPIGILADRGWRRPLILCGGAVFTLSLVLVAGAPSFPIILAGFLLFYPASGAFVSLSQASLMDLDPGRQAANMARWNFAGALGAVGGSGLMAGLIAIHWGWRPGYAMLAGSSLACLLPTFGVRAIRGTPSGIGESFADSLKALLSAFRRVSVVRWLVMLEAADLMLDVLTGFLAVFLVDVGHAPVAIAAIAVGIRLGSDLLGGLLVIPMVERLPGRVYIVASGLLQLVLYPAFVLLPSVPGRLLLLAVFSLTTAGWYPVLMAGLYGSMPGRSGMVATVTDASGLLAGFLPVAIGLLATRFGLAAAMWTMLLSPLLLLLGSLSRLEDSSLIASDDLATGRPPSDGR